MLQCFAFSPVAAGVVPTVQCSCGLRLERGARWVGLTYGGTIPRQDNRNGFQACKERAVFD